LILDVVVRSMRRKFNIPAKLSNSTPNKHSCCIGNELKKPLNISAGRLCNFKNVSNLW